VFIEGAVSWTSLVLVLSLFLHPSLFFILTVKGAVSGHKSLPRNYMPFYVSWQLLHWVIIIFSMKTQIGLKHSTFIIRHHQNTGVQRLNHVHIMRWKVLIIKRWFWLG